MDYQAPDPTVAELEMPWKSAGVEIWGSFNGVLLVDIDGELCLWNPSIRMYQKISRPKFTLCSIMYALGYDSINDDFKVVAAVLPTSDVPGTVHVFSSKLSSWKSTGDFGYSCRLYGRGSVLNGAPHWFARGSTDIEARYFRIACFDVMEEKFKEVPTPMYEVESNFFKVGVMDGCLCAVDSRLESHLNVWVMKEYGVEESWTKLFVVSNVPPNVPGESFFEYCALLCFTKDGEFVLRLNLGASVKLAIYNPKRKTYKRIGMPQNWKGFDADLYVESLVSPLGCNNTTRLPSTRSHPKMYQKFSQSKGENGSVKYGLCHDSVSDDFKFVGVNSRLSDGRSAVHVFTSKLSSWKRIGDFGEFYFSYIRVLCYKKVGEVVMKLDSEKLVIYNPKQNRYKRIEIPPDCKWFDAAFYMESLVSPRVCNGTS
ncbi:hypothetical protein RHSIM_Rhsim04G0210700 [Rhododendron simsii]|uniref:F-box associated beta-propeller type 3 domain-containing protein n=1 Tax=Rhododendron simsii TaxID=118357 RepID=A0A834H4I6_RHOSS|nr:hypothetical protein RHSIM_Rhsim04G0210700 [Rhododendron simsii]